MEAVSKIALDVIRWLSVAICTTVYVGFAYLMSTEFRVNQGTPLPHGFWEWSTSIIRYVILSTGALPLVVVIVWLWRAASWRMLAIGFIAVLGMLIYHYALVAVSAHSDSAYPWFQAGEFVLAWFALRFLVRISRSGGSSTTARA